MVLDYDYSSLVTSAVLVVWLFEYQASELAYLPH